MIMVVIGGPGCQSIKITWFILKMGVILKMGGAHSRMTEMALVSRSGTIMLEMGVILKMGRVISQMTKMELVASGW